MSHCEMNLEGVFGGVFFCVVGLLFIIFRNSIATKVPQYFYTDYALKSNTYKKPMSFAYGKKKAKLVVFFIGLTLTVVGAIIFIFSVYF